MAGGAGNDTYVVDNAGDIVTELLNEGTTDLVQVAIATAGGTYALTANVENGTLTNTVAFRLVGNTLNNTLTGNAAANTLEGGDGDDTLSGLAGIDTMVGGIGNDTYVVDVSTDVVTELTTDLGTDLVQAAATYTLNTNNAAGVENLTLTGTAAINGTGNALDNTITGNTGANILNGGLGADTLTGGAGNDNFVFNAIDYQTFFDIITDFKVSGTDRLQLSKTIFTGLQSATPNATGVALTPADLLSNTNVTASSSTGQHLLYDSDSGALYYDVDGQGGSDAFQIALLGQVSHPNLLSTDILVIV